MGVGSKCQNSTFSEHGHVAYQIKWNHECSNMVENILPTKPFPQPRPWGCGHDSTFSEHGHVAYQINWNHSCSNMVANILPADPTPTMEFGSKFNFFRAWSCCISNYRESRMKQHGSKYFAAYPPPPPPHTHTLEWGQNSTFSEHGHVK